MALPYKLNFRGTTAYGVNGGVGDGAGESVVPSSTETSGLQGIVYPTPVSGTNMGWDNATSGTRDSSTVPPAPFAGHHRNEAANLATFRIDLPSAGTYTIRLASGSYTGGFGTNKIEIFDNVTSKLTINASTSGADKYLDANYNSNTTERTSANWAANNQSVDIAFASTTFLLKVGSGAGLDTGVIAHLEIAAVVAATPTKPMWPMSFP